jgi:hypothetical protein
MVPEVLLLVKEIRPRRAEIDDLWASITILLQSRALKAVKGVADAFPAADNAFVLVVSKGALIADANESGRAHVRVADRTFAVTFVAEPSERDSCLLAAHDEIRVVAGHVCAEIGREASGDVLEMSLIVYWRCMELLKAKDTKRCGDGSVKGRGRRKSEMSLANGISKLRDLARALRRASQIPGSGA